MYVHTYAYMCICNIHVKLNYLPFIKSNKVANQERNPGDLKCRTTGIVKKMAIGML